MAPLMPTQCRAQQAYPIKFSPNYRNLPCAGRPLEHASLFPARATTSACPTACPAITVPALRVAVAFVAPCVSALPIRWSCCQALAERWSSAVAAAIPVHHGHYSIDRDVNGKRTCLYKEQKLGASRP